MTLPDLKQLDKLFTLCRKHGVEKVKLGDMEFELTGAAPIATAPARTSKSKSMDAGPFDPGPIPTEGITPSEEDLLFWSASGQLDANGNIPDGNAKQ